MPPASLILLLLLILAAVVVVVVLRRGAAQRDTHRVEAGALRAEAARREYEATVGLDPRADVSPFTAVDQAQEPALDRTEVFPTSGAGSETDMDEFQSTKTEDRSTPAPDHSHEADAATDDAATEHAPAEAGAAVVETAGIDRSAAELAQEPAEERFDPTPTRDWAADEGELLEETHERGERLEDERAELAQQAGDGAADAAAPDDPGDHTASDETADATASDGTADATAAGGRRISAFEELRDGGFGVGSAAPFDDGAQPLDHPVQAYRDTMTYRVPGDAGYDSAQPHLWFYDEGAAERSGFRRADG